MIPQISVVSMETFIIPLYRFPFRPCCFFASLIFSIVGVHNLYIIGSDLGGLLRE